MQIPADDKPTTSRQRGSLAVGRAGTFPGRRLLPGSAASYDLGPRCFPHELQKEGACFPVAGALGGQPTRHRSRHVQNTSAGEGPSEGQERTWQVFVVRGHTCLCPPAFSLALSSGGPLCVYTPYLCKRPSTSRESCPPLTQPPTLSGAVAKPYRTPEETLAGHSGKAACLPLKESHQRHRLLLCTMQLPCGPWSRSAIGKPPPEAHCHCERWTRKAESGSPLRIVSPSSGSGTREVYKVRRWVVAPSIVLLLSLVFIGCVKQMILIFGINRDI